PIDLGGVGRHRLTGANKKRTLKFAKPSTATIACQAATREVEYHAQIWSSPWPAGARRQSRRIATGNGPERAVHSHARLSHRTVLAQRCATGKRFCRLLHAHQRARRWYQRR